MVADKALSAVDIPSDDGLEDGTWEGGRQGRGDADAGSGAGGGGGGGGESHSKSRKKAGKDAGRRRIKGDDDEEERDLKADRENSWAGIDIEGESEEEFYLRHLRFLRKTPNSQVVPYLVSVGVRYVCVWGTTKLPSGASSSAVQSCPCSRRRSCAGHFSGSHWRSPALPLGGAETEAGA